MMFIKDDTDALEGLVGGMVLHWSIPILTSGYFGDQYH